MSTPISTSPQGKKDFITRLSEWSLRYVPDSMVFVLSLTILVYFMAWGLTDSGPLKIVDHWLQGFWVLLTFAMQMCVLMITGYVVADSKQVKAILKRIAQVPKTPVQAVMMFTAIVGVLWWIHWGIGMMAGIMLGRQIAVFQKGKGLHYTALVACAYTATLSANGPSMAAPLIMATPGHFMEKVVDVIPLSYTVFDVRLLIMNLIVICTVPILMAIVLPKKNVVEIDDQLAASFVDVDETKEDKSKLTPAQRWDRSPWLITIIGIAGLYWVFKFFYTKGVMNLDLNTLNFTFLIIGILLHRTPMLFMESVKRATGTVFGVIIQFPFYAGIFGMINYSGLAQVIAGWFVSISTAGTYPWIVFVYSAILNFFVPSGGSKFVVEAPYILPAAQQLGANVHMVINAYTNGDLITNLLQPFWALPILGAFKVTFRDILPYSLIAFIWGFIVISCGYLIFMH